MSFNKTLNQQCKGNVIKDSKYSDQQVNGHHVNLIIILASDDIYMEF